MMNSVLSMLLRYVNGQYKKDTHYDIALSLLTHYSEISRMTINDLADICYVSPASISRFIKMLGFQSFHEFKDACKNTLAIENTDYSREVSKATKEDIEPIFERYTDHVIENIRYTYNQISYDQLDRISHMIYESEDVLMLGLEFSTLLAQHFQNRFALMNKYIKIGLSYEEQLELVKSLKEKSLVFILTIEGGYFYRNDEIIRLLLQKNTKIVALTMNTQSKLMKEVDEIIICSKENSDTEGRVSLLYVLELLIMYYCINFSHR